MSLQIEKSHLDIVKAIFKNRKVIVYAFGSRTKGNAQKFSDLDLVVKSQISKSELHELRSLFEESNLPFKVDLIVWGQIDTIFQNHIEKDLVQLNLS